MVITLPRLYPIVDAERFPNAGEMIRFAQQLASGGCRLLQYRNKRDGAPTILQQARELKRALDPSITLIMNDRVDLSLAAGFDGVHLGQEDLSPESARSILGAKAWLGVSTHTSRQVEEAERTSADYLAIGPVFSTAGKLRPEPVVGLEGVRRARELSKKPLVAIGGITRDNCRSVIAAGADSVAVISALLPWAKKSAEDFFRVLG